MSVIIQLNRRGVGELLTSADVQADIMRRANAVAAAAGPGHDVLNTTTDRARAHVMTQTDEARLAQAENHNLVIALNAARG